MLTDNMSYRVWKPSGKEVQLADRILLFYCIEGEITVRLSYQNNRMHKGDILLVRAGVEYTVGGTSGSVCGCASYSMNLFDELVSGTQMLFYCNSVQDTTGSYSEIRNLFFRLTAAYADRKGADLLRMDALLLRILECLVKNYRRLDDVYEEEGNTGTEDDPRVMRIKQYVVTHLAEKISLDELARPMHLSVSTLSRLFKKATGMYFSAYLVSLRVKVSENLLAHTDKNLTQIASLSGFSDSSSFSRSFRQVHGISPSDFRNKAKERARLDEERLNVEETLLRTSLREQGFSSEDNRKELSVHLNGERLSGTEGTGADSLRENWNKMINIGALSNLLRTNVQYHITYLHQNLGYDYIRVWSIFSEQMQICDGKTKGRYFYDLLDQTLDFLVKYHLKPFLDFGSRAESARHSDSTLIYYDESNICFASRDLWEDAVFHLIRHLTGRYGKEKVSEWIFELSLVEDQKLVPIYQAIKYNFSDAYACFYRILKKEVPDALFGGISAGTFQQNLMETFLNRCREEEMMPDFLSFCIFPNAISLKEEFPDASDPAETGSTGKKQILEIHDVVESNQLGQIRELLDRFDIPQTRLIITDWNQTLSNEDFSNDACYRGAYFVQCILEVFPEVEMVGVLAGTDWISKYTDFRGILTGNLGILSRDMIRKPAYYAIDFLNNLGRRVIRKGEHYIATQDEDGGLHILCYNFMPLMRGKDLNEYRIPQKYLQMEDQSCDSLFFDFSIEGMDSACEYALDRMRLNKENGSALDLWEEFECTQTMQRPAVRYLVERSMPTLSHQRLKMDSRKLLHFRVELKPYEITVLNITAQFD